MYKYFYTVPQRRACFFVILDIKTLWWNWVHQENVRWGKPFLSHLDLAVLRWDSIGFFLILMMRSFLISVIGVAIKRDTLEFCVLCFAPSFTFWSGNKVCLLQPFWHVYSGWLQACCSATPNHQRRPSFGRQPVFQQFVDISRYGSNEIEKPVGT